MFNFRQYRAPREHGESFVEPSFDKMPGALSENQQTLADYPDQWNQVRENARKQLIQDALRYTSAYRDTSWYDRSQVDQPIVMAGHQPSLFHPGVWFKNFALDHLARRFGGTAVNLVVDNDVSRGSAIRVPTIDSNTGLAVNRTIAFDDFGGGVPYEQTTIRNLDRFERFADEVTRTVAPLVSDPCIQQLWPHAVSAVKRCGVAGCALAQARHGFEGDIGLQSLEIPLGVVCRSRSFICFLLNILTDMPRFQSCYNDATSVYRTAHGIRSSAHPVPDLSDDGEWYEAPLWIYGNQSPERKAAWIRQTADGLEVSDLGTRTVKIDHQNRSDAIDQLTAAMTPEFKIRPRALITTMYARLILSDLFLHGIGGGKYDQLGDQITKGFFELEPPQYVVMSSTVHLPDIQPSDVEQRIGQLKRRIRETQFQGERFPEALETNETLVRQKRELLQRVPLRGQRQAWHREITRVNEQLSYSLSKLRGDLQQQLIASQREAAAASILESREHSFCVYPLEYLTENFAKMLPATEATYKRP